MSIRCYLWVGLPFLSFFFFFHCRNCFLWISFWHSQIPIQKSIQFQKTLFNWIPKSNETELMFYTQQSNHQVHIVKVFILFIANCAVKNFIISIVQNCECVCVPLNKSNAIFFSKSKFCNTIHADSEFSASDSHVRNPI